MKNFLNNLERAAKELVSNVDGYVQEPLVRVITGEVFSNGVDERTPRKAHDETVKIHDMAYLHEEKLKNEEMAKNQAAPLRKPKSL